MPAQRTSGGRAKKSTAKRPIAVAGKPRKTVSQARRPESRQKAGIVKAKPADGKAKAAPVLKAAAPKPIKISSGLSKSDLAHFRELLLEKRREILGDVGSMESEAFKAGSNLSNMPIHMADVGTDNFEQEFTLGLIESERQILREIQEALLRVETGIYGVCQGTGKVIPKVRLEAVPWAKYTAEYARALEQGLIRREGGFQSDDDSGGGGGGGDDEEE